jgi:hypothetical protein
MYRRQRTQLGIVVTALALLVYGSTQPVWGLPAEHAEHFGNARIGNEFGFNADALAAVNLDSRVYWYEVNGNPTFFFHGDTEALNQALTQFAAIKNFDAAKGERLEVVLLPGVGDTRNFKGDLIPSDWNVQIPAGFRRPSTNPRLTIHISQEKMKLTVEEKQVLAWIASLDNDDFAKREHADQELTKLGTAVRPLLRKALEAKPAPSAEAPRRIKGMLDKLKGIELDQLKIPKGIAVLEVSDLLEKARKSLKSKDAQERGLAAGDLGGLGYYGEDVLPELVKVLKTDKEEYARASAAFALGRLDKIAETALPALREGAKDSNKVVSNACEQALAMFAKAKDEPNKDAEAKKMRAIRKTIHEFHQALSDKTQAESP